MLTLIKRHLLRKYQTLNMRKIKVSDQNYYWKCLYCQNVSLPCWIFLGSLLETKKNSKNSKQIALGNARNHLKQEFGKKLGLKYFEPKPKHGGNSNTDLSLEKCLVPVHNCFYSWHFCWNCLCSGKMSVHDKLHIKCESHHIREICKTSLQMSVVWSRKLWLHKWQHTYFAMSWSSIYRTCTT